MPERSTSVLQRQEMERPREQQLRTRPLQPEREKTLSERASVFALRVIMLSDDEGRFLAHQRVAYLATADRCAVPHVVPVCFAIVERTLYITIDEKPKRVSS